MMLEGVKWRKDRWTKTKTFEGVDTSENGELTTTPCTFISIIE